MNQPLVLLVEDSPTMRAQMTSVLQSLGFVVDAVEDGEVAWQWAQTMAPHWLLSDCDMPRRDGFSLLAAVRQLPHWRNVPCVLYSAEDSPARRLKARQAGAAAWMVKPVMRQDLLAVLAALGIVPHQASETIA